LLACCELPASVPFKFGVEIVREHLQICQLFATENCNSIILVDLSTLIVPVHAATEHESKHFFLQFFSTLTQCDCYIKRMKVTALRRDLYFVRDLHLKI